MNEPPSPARPADLGVAVVVEDLQSDHPIELERWAQLAQHALAARQVKGGELTLTFVDEATIAELNLEHMGVEGPTDVLSFPLDAELALGDLPASDVPLLLGDVIICPALAARTAPDRLGVEPHPGFPGHDGSFEHELALLVVHGVLHVLGMDHAEPGEAALMHQAEEAILTTFAAASSGPVAPPVTTEPPPTPDPVPRPRSSDD